MENKRSAFDTPSYFAKQILPEESDILRRQIVEDKGDRPGSVFEGIENMLLFIRRL